MVFTTITRREPAGWVHANVPTSRARRRVGTVMAGLAILFLLFDSVGKLLMVSQVVEGSVQLGYPVYMKMELNVIALIGIILLVCVVVYAVPSTSVLGAILLTGYLGGAVATQLRVGSPLLTHTLFPVYLGALIWGSLLLR